MLTANSNILLILEMHPAAFPVVPGKKAHSNQCICLNELQAFWYIKGPYSILRHLFKDCYKAFSQQQRYI